MMDFEEDNINDEEEAENFFVLISSAKGAYQELNRTISFWWPVC